MPTPTNIVDPFQLLIRICKKHAKELVMRRHTDNDDIVGVIKEEYLRKMSRDDYYRLLKVADVRECFQMIGSNYLLSQPHDFNKRINEELDSRIKRALTLFYSNPDLMFQK